MIYCKHEAENDTNQAEAVVQIMFNRVLALCGEKLLPEIMIVSCFDNCNCKNSENFDNIDFLNFHYPTPNHCLKIPSYQLGITTTMPEPKAVLIL